MKQPKLSTWRVHLIRNRAIFPGTVEARTADEAISVE